MFRKKTFLVLTILTLLITACGGSTETPAPPPTSPEMTTAPTAAPEEATETPLPATDTPAPTPEPTPEPTLAGSAGACDHAYFPVREGRTLRYQVQTPQGDSEYTIAFFDVAENEFTMRQTFPEATSEIRWQCTEDGLVSSEYAHLSITQVPEMTVETLSYEGVYLPPAEEWEVGMSWVSSYTINIGIDIEGAATSIEMDITIENEIAAVEEVSVQAGTYPEAYRVDATATTAGSGTAGFPVSFDFTSSTWYVEGVGQVKMVSDSAGGTTTIELLAIE